MSIFSIYLSTFGLDPHIVAMHELERSGKLPSIEEGVTVNQELIDNLVKKVKEIELEESAVNATTYAYRHLSLEFCRHNGHDFNNVLTKLGMLQSEKLRIEVAKNHAQYGSEISKHIKEYRITDEDGLIEIAKIDADRFDSEISKYIQNYGIKKQDALIEIAKIDADRSDSEISKYIQNYGIKKQNALIEIAKIAADRSDSEISKYIQSFGIKDENALIEIAKIAANRFDNEISKYIQNYGIKKQDALIEIAKIAADRSDSEISKYIQNYGIKDEEALTEIAKIAAKRDGRTSKYIQSFGIKDENALIEIVKIAVSRDDWRTSKYIQNYGIKDEEALTEIAKFAVNENAMTSRHIKNYGIKDENALIEIFKIAFNKDGGVALNNLQKFGLSKKNLFETFLYCFAQTRQTLDSFPHDILSRILPLGLDVDHFTSVENIPSALKNLKNQFPDFLPVIEKIESQKDLFVQKEQYYWLLYTLLRLGGKFDKTIVQGLLKVLNYREPQFRYILSDQWASLVENSAILKLFDTKRASFAIIFQPSFALLFLEGVAFVRDRWESITKAKKGKNKVFKNSREQRVLLKALHALNNPNFSKEEKGRLLVKLLPKSNTLSVNWEERINVLQTFTAIVDLDGEKHLKKALKDRGQIDFNEINRRVFQEKIPLSENVPDFTERFGQTVGKLRDPKALYIYAGKLSGNLLDFLGEITTYILKGTFKKERYEKNIHLDTVFKGRDALKEEWIRGVKIQLKKGVSEISKEFDFQSFFDRKIADGHLGKEFNHLCKRSPEEIGRRITKLNKNKERSLKEDRELKGLSILKFFAHRKSINSAEVKKLRELVESYPPAREFLNDISVLEKLTNKAKAPQENETFSVVDSDEPDDLLLSGTEVEGSCQRVNGDPQNNQGLLGYLMNGQTRLLALKESSGKIVARRILRLLWDERKQVPVLFLERLYPDVISNEHEKALMEMAKKRAQALNLDLLIKDDGDAPYNGKICSLGGRAPCEYVDASDGIAEDSLYTISDVQLVKI